MTDETATPSRLPRRTRAPWSTRKRDQAPKGLFRHASSTDKVTVWGIRFVCGRGCRHEELIGPSKTEAVRSYRERKVRVHREPDWCPRRERQQQRAQEAQQRQAARDAAAAQRARRDFDDYSEEYLVWIRPRLRSCDTAAGCIRRVGEGGLGRIPLDAVTTADIERVLTSVLVKQSRSTWNRYRAILHAMLARAVRHGLLDRNPVTNVSRFRESEGRVLFLQPGAEEDAVRAQLSPEALRTGRPTLDARHADLRPLFSVSVHTGLRWSEQIALTWGDVDFLTGLLTVRRSKSGYGRHVPMNSVVRSVLLDLAAMRFRPDDPEERVFRCSFTEADKFFPAAVARAKQTLTAAGADASRLEGYTWHCNRHTFASRLVMAGVDLRTVQVLGGWRTLAMVQRYSHLSPAHLREAVERLVSRAARPLSRPRRLRDYKKTTSCRCLRRLG